MEKRGHQVNDMQSAKREGKQKCSVEDGSFPQQPWPNAA